MSDITLCRVCLAVNLRVHSIANTQLQEIYENLTRIKTPPQDKPAGIIILSFERMQSFSSIRQFAEFCVTALESHHQFLTQDGWPATVCYICLSQLQRCLKLVDLAQCSEKLLLQLYHSGIEISQDTVLMLDRVALSYSVTPIESISLLASCETGITSSSVKEPEMVKQEPVESLRKDLCEVLKDDTTEVKMDSDYDYEQNMSSDSDDNLPLTAFKESKIYNKVKIKHKRSYQKDVKIDAVEVLLTKDQQMAAVVARSKSLNYLNSPFKCHLCYKGFVNQLTYNNHTQKHDEISGVHVCEICALRYHSARLLRTHAMTAHVRCYKCNKCEHVSHTTNQARDHDKWHEGFTFECQLCSQKFRKRTSYLTHTRKNHPSESVCDLCGYSFVGKNGLLLHKSKTHKRDTEEEKPSVPLEERFCMDCNMQFACAEAYHRHLLSSVRHTLTDNSTQCIICKQNHLDNGSLMEHMKVHKKKLLHPAPVVDLSSVQAKLPCDVCGASFSSRSRLAAHVSRKHLGVKYARHVVCELCGLQFTSFASLRYHQRRHRGERPHACTRCHARFSDAHQLRVHVRTHSGERPYSCRTCARTFTQKPALNRHYRVHTGAKPYVCEVCSKCFSQSNSLKIHVQSVHLKMPPHRKRKRATSKTDCQIEINKEN